MYVITGANGYTGAFLAVHLLNQNIPVRALVRSEQDGKKLQALGAEVIVSPSYLHDISILELALQNAKGVYHIAAAFRNLKEDEDQYYQTNVVGTKNLIDIACKMKVPRIVYCSTNGVCATNERKLVDTKAPYSPNDYYQRSKMEAEQLVLQYSNRGLIDARVIRPAMIYGPGDARLGKIFKLVHQGRFFYIGKGDALVHFIDVRDLADAFLKAMELPSITEEKVFLIANERPMPLKECVDIIADCYQVSPPRLHIPIMPTMFTAKLCETVCKTLKLEPPLYPRRVEFFTKNRAFDTSVGDKILGFAPKQSAIDELKEIAAYYQKVQFNLTLSPLDIVKEFRTVSLSKAVTDLR